MNGLQMKYPGVASVVVLLWFGAPSSARAPDLQQLKTKLQQLEQMMQDLKQQIAIAEASESTPVAPAPAKTSPPSKVPLPELPTTYIGDLTRTREVANQDSDDAARLDARMLTHRCVVSSDCPERGL